MKKLYYIKNVHTKKYLAHYRAGFNLGFWNEGLSFKTRKEAEKFLIENIEQIADDICFSPNYIIEEVFTGITEIK